MNFRMNKSRYQFQFQSKISIFFINKEMKAHKISTKIASWGKSHKHFYDRNLWP